MSYPPRQSPGAPRVRAAAGWLVPLTLILCASAFLLCGAGILPVLGGSSLALAEQRPVQGAAENHGSRDTGAFFEAPAMAAAVAPVAEVSMKPGCQMIVIPVRVGGRTCDFVMDTGMTYSAIDPSLRPGILGKSIERGVASTPIGQVKVEFFRPPPMTIGSLPFKPPFVTSMNMKPFARVMGRDIKGFIGMDFMRQYAVQFDWNARKVRLYPSGAVQTSLRTPVHTQMGVPAARVVVDEDVAGDFVVDTGCNLGGCLTRGLYRQAMDSQARTQTQRILMTAAGGTIRSSQARIDTIRPAGAAPTGKGLYFGQSQYNLLGLGYLRRQTVTLDFPAGTIYWSSPAVTRMAASSAKHGSRHYAKAA